jgi:Mg2+-importing ATPase
MADRMPLYSINRNRNGQNPKQQKPLKIDHEYVTYPVEQLLNKLRTSLDGLSEGEAEDRLQEYGYNELAEKKEKHVIIQFISKFTNPLVVVLIIIATFSLYLGGSYVSALLVYAMAAISVALSFAQEYRAGREVEKLRKMVQTTATVYRDGKKRELNLRNLVPGDIVYLSAGDIIPADLRVISSKDLFINQSSLTGESFPVEKTARAVYPSSYSVIELNNILFMGTSVVSGTGLGVVVYTGIRTQFGELSKRLTQSSMPSSFDIGVNSFTWLMIRFMMVMVAVIFAINVLAKGNVPEAFMFSLAVAVGLTPEMLPMLVALNLSRGSIAMSKKKVIVKRLNSIQNFGAMDILCTDKTGTITLGEVVLEQHCDVLGREDEEVLRYAYINSYHQTGLKNLLDRAILKHEDVCVEEFRKIDEIPFDFSRKIMSVVVAMNGKSIIISKGAPEEVLKRCTRLELDGRIMDLEPQLPELKLDLVRTCGSGFRVLMVAYRELEKKESYSKEDERDLILRGYVAFLDPPKETAKEAIEALRRLGIELKVLTGDNVLITRKICGDVGLNVRGIVTGEDVDLSDDVVLARLAEKTTVFALLTPLQKERIIRVLQKNKHTVGFLGDGINDAPSLKAADVGISVENAADAARETADMILLEKSLMVLEDGVIEGRRTFGNIIKYVKMGASSNFGNMLSMTGASIFLPFLPMLPIQILLNNLLYDLSQVAIPTDYIDEDYLADPKPWDVDFIKKFMLIFGPVSSIFDFITYGILLFLFHASPSLFHTGWFLESLATQTLVIYIIRTSKIPFLESWPSRPLVLTSILIILLGFLIALSPFGSWFGFIKVPNAYFLALMAIVATYLMLVQIVKRQFIKRYGFS